MKLLLLYYIDKLLSLLQPVFLKKCQNIEQYIKMLVIHHEIIHIRIYPCRMN